MTTKNEVIIGNDQLRGRIKLKLLQGSWFAHLAGDFSRPRLATEPEVSITDYWMRAVYTSGGWCTAATIVFHRDALAPPTVDQRRFTNPRIYHWESVAPRASSIEVQILLGETGLRPPEQPGALVDVIPLDSGTQLAAVIRGGRTGAPDQGGVDELKAVESGLRARTLAFGWEHPDRAIRIVDWGSPTYSG
ncbi:hypothetical protein MKUB_30940 [Mycobacterium kubicae]|uniref:Uncharacterized protein n=1 Tax=Mycobacterium kubicae TaxID=120959 RepID=A0ABQ1BPI9_9MYCO|nr:hypothetical protein AWC13_12395 [Mycobacterium kubicae]GFG65604.1 hypothetical protein MKUB_30940 [Mycobacterium kubicae]